MSLLIKIFSGISISVFMIGMLFSCKNDIKEIEALTGEKNLPVQTTYNAVYNYTENGKIRNKLEAAQLDRFLGEDPHIAVSNGFKLTIYDSLESVEAVLNAKRGIYREEEQIMEAHENVVLRNVSGAQLDTEELIWLQDSGKVYTDKLVTITSEKGVIQGKGLISNESFTDYSIKEISGDVFIPEKDSLQ